MIYTRAGLLPLFFFGCRMLTRKDELTPPLARYRPNKISAVRLQEACSLRRFRHSISGRRKANLLSSPRKLWTCLPHAISKPNFIRICCTISGSNTQLLGIRGQQAVCADPDACQNQ